MNSTLFEITQNVSVEFWIFGISSNFCTIKIDLSGNTVWVQATCFLKLAKVEPFLAFLIARFARNVEWDFFCAFQPLCPQENLSEWW